MSLDPESGDPLWRKPLEGLVSGIAGADPPIVQTPKPDRPRVFGHDGEPRSTIEIGTGYRLHGDALIGIRAGRRQAPAEAAPKAYRRAPAPPGVTHRGTGAPQGPYVTRPLR